ncbi:flagellar filament capping protein FliD [Comamonas kerstersii]|uniref:flagellar filament capping protein FliD n=1 Tax=Comamonas kerstersii TaxID=225992 RepID=UPI002597C178|nr:flagellar filament capping protein FliD [Comamonas kerstersii]
MAISSVGIGSGLDVESLVTQMIALEKRPIKTLEAKAEVIQSKISTYGEIKSLTDDLNAAVRDLTLDRTWNTVKISSSNSTAVSATMTGAAQAASYNVEVVRLAQAQTSVSDKFDKTETMGAAGSLSFTLHGQTTSITIDVAATDTIENVMAKINAHETLSKSLAASVVADSTGKLQLMVRARDSGASGSFTMDVTGATADADNKLGKLGFVVGGQIAQDAEIKLNGVNMLSSTNTFADIIPGLSITVSEAGKSSVLNLTQDKDAIKDSIQKFVDAYNALNDLLGSSTKYDQDSKVAGVLQGDSSTVSLQNALRMLTQGVAGQAKGAFNRLADAGIQMLQGGKLSMDSTKLATALNDMDSLKQMFAVKADALGNGGGIAVNFKAFTDELLAYEGTLNSKTDSLEDQLKRNASEVERVETRADTVEARLRKQYSALDVKMASLSPLSSYVEQMVASWNKSKD